MSAVERARRRAEREPESGPRERAGVEVLAGGREGSGDELALLLRISAVLARAGALDLFTAEEHRGEVTLNARDYDPDQNTGVRDLLDQGGLDATSVGGCTILVREVA